MTTKFEQVVFEDEYVTLSVFGRRGLAYAPYDLQSDFEQVIIESIRDFFLETQLANDHLVRGFLL